MKSLVSPSRTRISGYPIQLTVDTLDNRISPIYSVHAHVSEVVYPGRTMAPGYPIQVTVDIWISGYRRHTIPHGAGVSQNCSSPVVYPCPMTYLVRSAYLPYRDIQISRISTVNSMGIHQRSMVESRFDDQSDIINHHIMHLQFRCNISRRQLLIIGSALGDGRESS